MLNILKNLTLRYLISIFLILCFGMVGAQTDKKLSYLFQEKLQKANEYYDISDFKNAIDLYKEIIEKIGTDTAIIYKIADSYRLLNDSKNAEEWYRKALVNNESAINPIYKLYFAQVLTTNGKYEEAKYWFKEYNKTISSDSRAFEGIRSIENLPRLYYDTAFYLVYPISLNTKYSEFGPCFYKNGIVFLSDLNTAFYKEKNTMTNTGFLALYFSAIDSAGNFSKPTKFNKEIETKYHEGPVAFFDNYKKMIFTRNYEADKMDKNKINVINLQLFFAAQETNGEWKNVQLLNCNNINYSFAQPSITNDGKTLYFSSNMTGGYGGTDLYVSKFENSIWQPPVNLGGSINTAGDEMFPHIFNDTILYFSSNGHGGLGGMDIFKTNLKYDHKIENLGAPINSGNDDVGIIMNKDGLSGYFSSTRPGSGGSDDIYGFKLVRQSMAVKIIDVGTTLPVPGATIFTNDTAAKQIGFTNQDGYCNLTIPIKANFTIKISKEKYVPKSFTFEPIVYSPDNLIVISLYPETIKKEEYIVLTDKKNQHNIVYKVQIRASRIPVYAKELNKLYRGRLKINNFYEDGWYKYSIGEYPTYAEAKQCLYTCEVSDAFIIAFIDNKKVHINIAKANSKETDIKSPINRTNWFNR